MKNWFTGLALAVSGIIGAIIYMEAPYRANEEYTFINKCWGRSAAITTTGQSFQLSPLGAADSKIVFPYSGEIVAMSINCRTSPITTDVWVTMNIGGSLKTTDTLKLPVGRTEADIDSLRFQFEPGNILYPQTIQATSSPGADDCVLCIYARIKRSAIKYDNSTGN